MSQDWAQIRKLSELVARNKADRDLDEERHKKLEERSRTVKEAPDRATMEFWCRKCRRDFGRLALKRTIDYPSGVIAYYEAPCIGCGIWCRRFITDKTTDPYFMESERLKRMRSEMADDLLQPGDPRYAAKYGDPNKKRYERMEQDERESWLRNRPTSRVLPS